MSWNRQARVADSATWRARRWPMVLPLRVRGLRLSCVNDWLLKAFVRMLYVTTKTGVCR